MQRFIAFDDSVQEKIKNFGDACVVIQSLPAREICRHGTHIALDVALTHKTFNAVGKLSRIARAQSAVLVKKIADKVRKVPSRSVLVVTAEGVELPIVSESLHLLTESQNAMGGSSLSKSLAALQSKFKVVIEGVEEILPEVAKLNGNDISHILQPKHGWELLVYNPKDWDAVARIISKAMKEGIEKIYGKTGIARMRYLKVGKEMVEVTFRKMSSGEIKIGDAWIDTLKKNLKN